WISFYNGYVQEHLMKELDVQPCIQMLDNADNMPGKWQLLIYLGQCQIKQLQNQKGASQNCS
ncbi:transposase, partial [bacterium D16-51]